MRLIIVPHATPTAHHSPIRVPLHWRNEVKAGLDCDVKLGGIEPVPIGESYGDDIDTALHHKATLRQVMATRGVVTRLSPPFQTKPNVSTTPSYGLTQLKESFFQAANWLDNCGRHGITVNPEKFRFAEDAVEFAGFEITNDSVRLFKKSLRAMYDFHKFHWNAQLQAAFKKWKETIIDDIVIIFDKTKRTCLATDWSKTGIGYWLFQKHCICLSNELFCCKQARKSLSLEADSYTQPNLDTHLSKERH